MPWQDLVLGFGAIIFALALLPSIVDQQKPALLTSILTGCMLLTFAVTFVTLDLWFSATVNVITASLWFVLAAQRYKQQRLAADQALRSSLTNEQVHPLKNADAPQLTAR